jgi:hypothetical protein
VQLFDALIESNQLVDVFSDHGIRKREQDIIKELIMGGPLDSSQPPLLKPKDNFLYEVSQASKTFKLSDKCSLIKNRHKEIFP